MHWFKVALRIRPLNDAEIEEGATTVAHKIDNQVKNNTKDHTCPALPIIPVWNCLIKWLLTLNLINRLVTTSHCLPYICFWKYMHNIHNSWLGVCCCFCHDESWSKDLILPFICSKSCLQSVNKVYCLLCLCLMS